MKNITILKYLIVEIIFFSGTKMVAQTVTVPAGCTVVSPGTGGNVALGLVGSGGIVRMPDPFTGGAFTFNPASGQTVTGWKLQGDLSVIGAPPPVLPPAQNAIQIGPAVNSLSIMSYNKTLRPFEANSATPTLARSKGSVSVSYIFTTINNCSGTGFIAFEVYKTYTSPLPAIVGPNCVEAGKQYTYSVDAIASDNLLDAIGLDQYYWTGFPSIIGTAYYSADFSSVTFTPATNTGFILKCAFGRANPWDGGFIPLSNPTQATVSTTFVTKAVGTLPTEPTYSISPNNLCVPTGGGASTSFVINYTSPYTCTWSSPNTGWTVGTPVGSGTNKSVTINTNGYNNPGILIVTVNNGSCNPLTFQYQINRSLTAPIVIAPVVANNNCLSLNSSNNIFNISSSATANSLTWSVSPTGTGVTLVPSTTDSSVAVNVSATATAGTYTLSAKTTSCIGTITYTFYVKPATPSITGSTCVVRSTTQIPTNASYTCTTITGATGYLWTLPAGWTAQAPAVLLSGTNYRTTSNSISVVPAGTGTVAVNLCVKAQGATTGSSATSVGCDSNTSANFTVNYITVNYSSALIYDVYSISGSCVTTVKQWRVNKTIYTPTSGNTSFGNITIGSAGGINNYVNVTGTNGSPVTQVCANIGTIATPVWVCATTFGSFTQRQANPALNAPKEEIKSVMIAPNPNSGNFNIKLASNDEMATATLFDFLGNKIQTYLLQKGDNAIQKENLKKGTYFVLLAVDGKEESRQIIIK